MSSSIKGTMKFVTSCAGAAAVASALAMAAAPTALASETVNSPAGGQSAGCVTASSHAFADLFAPNLAC
jgi:hypothetical protein